ncbi:MAG: hypothetical protein CI953_12 [Methanohalophilus sp.]|nr:MAG: hypothetical protein CI953_12 [Methanohalophilus sp.]
MGYENEGTYRTKTGRDEEISWAEKSKVLGEREDEYPGNVNRNCS